MAPSAAVTGAGAQHPPSAGQPRPETRLEIAPGPGNWMVDIFTLVNSLVFLERWRKVYSDAL